MSALHAHEGEDSITERMPVEPLHIWSNFPWQGSAAERLREGAAHCRLTFAPKDPDDSGPEAAQADVLLGQPNPDSLTAPNSRVRWVQLTSAGYTRYDREDVRQALHGRGAMLTNSSHVFDEPCAQHLVAMMFALARQLPQALDNQRGARAWPHGAERRGKRPLLNGQRVLIYGFGAIARRTVELLAPLQMRVSGVRRAAQGDEGIPILTQEEADARLGKMDHVLNILPENDSTQGFFGAERLARCKPGACFYNIGRGATVDQGALLAALREGRLEAAYLDVTDPEPLPPESPLWSAPGCFISPHVAGAHVDEDERLMEHFLANLAAFKAGNALRGRVF